MDLLKQPGFYNDIAISTREGEFRYVTVKVKHVDLDGEDLALAMISDDTERLLLMRDLASKHYTLETAYTELENMHHTLKTTQEKMFQASKLVALGELAAGISHELNQPLTGVRGFAQEIADIVKDDKTQNQALLTELCKEIVLNADKMAELLSHLRTFAREEKRSIDHKEEDSEDVSLKTVVSNVTKLFDKQLQTKNIQLDVRYEDKDYFVRALSHPIEQIVINLLANARDAIVEKYQDGKKNAGHILVNFTLNKDFVEVRVSDNGGGVPQSIKDQIFNPFFTTKDPDKGMGLGLALSFSIAHRFGGELSLESSSKAGSTFLLKLKASSKGKKELAA